MCSTSGLPSRRPINACPRKPKAPVTATDRPVARDCCKPAGRGLREFEVRPATEAQVPNGAKAIIKAKASKAAERGSSMALDMGETNLPSGRLH